MYFRVRSDPAYGSLSHRDVDRMDQGEGVDGAVAQGGPAGLRALEGREARRGHRVDGAVGRGPPRLAHRVLGDGRGAARRRLRDPRRRQRPRLPPPRERGGPDAAARTRRRAGADLDAQRDARRSARREDGQERRQHRARWPRCSARWGRDALVLFFARATTASRWPSPTTRSRGASGRVAAACARPARRLVDGPSPAELAPHRDALLRRAGRRLQHAAGAGRALGVGRARPTRAPTGRAGRPRGPRRDARGPRPRGPARAAPTGTARRDAQRPAAPPPGGARRAGLGARPTACATSCAARGWQVRDGAGGASSSPDEPPAAAARRRGRGRGGAPAAGAAGAGGRPRGAPTGPGDGPARAREPGRGRRPERGRRGADRPARASAGPRARSSTAATRSARRCAPDAGGPPRLGDRRGGAGAVAGGLDVEVVDADELPSGARHRRPPGPRAPTSRPTRTPTPRRCCRPDAAGSSRSTRSRTRRTSARSAARPSAPGADGVVLPERRRAAVTPAVGQGVGRGGRAPRGRPGAQPRRLPRSRRKAAGCWVYGAAAGAGAVRTTSPTTPAASSSSWAPRAGLRPRVAGACDDVVALPLRGRVESLNVSAAAAVLLYEISQRR